MYLTVIGLNMIMHYYVMIEWFVSHNQTTTEFLNAVGVGDHFIKLRKSRDHQN